MNTKKAKHPTATQVDPKRPVKADATTTAGRPAKMMPQDVPTYDGPEKRAPTAGPRRAKAATEQPGGGKPKPSKPKFVATAAKRTSRAGGSQIVPDLPDQKPRRRRSGSAGEQYIRLRIRVRGEQLTVLDSHLVNGPLGQATGFAGSNVYEVTNGERLLHAGGLPDLGVQRSFRNPYGPEAEEGHHLSDRSTYEFMARVPAHEVTADSIGQIAVRLHRLKDQVKAERLHGALLTRQFERSVRPVASLTGLPSSVLPEEIEARGGRTPTL